MSLVSDWSAERCLNWTAISLNDNVLWGKRRGVDKNVFLDGMIGANCNRLSLLLRHLSVCIERSDLSGTEFRLRPFQTPPHESIFSFACGHCIEHPKGTTYVKLRMMAIIALPMGMIARVLSFPQTINKRYIVYLLLLNLRSRHTTPITYPTKVRIDKVWTPYGVIEQLIVITIYIPLWLVGTRKWIATTLPVQSLFLLVKSIGTDDSTTPWFNTYSTIISLLWPFFDPFPHS